MYQYGSLFKAAYGAVISVKTNRELTDEEQESFDVKQEIEGLTFHVFYNDKEANMYFPNAASAYCYAFGCQFGAKESMGVHW